jgi:peptidoglycan/xylan/chitin deacetylase (PgdA/CDA1 family)
LRQGEPLPQRCAVISIDDGYRTFLTDGWPLLRQYGYPATLFVSTDTVGGGDYLSWQELSQLQTDGVEIGNHSASHAYLLDRLPDENASDWRVRVTEELKRSRIAFEKHLGSSPNLFAYPYGEYSSELKGLIEAAGFTAAFGQQSGVITAAQDFFALPRFPVGGSYSDPAEFRSKLFMEGLEVSRSHTQDTVIKEENPPILKLYLNVESVDESTLRCFVPGQAECLLKEIPGAAGGYEVRARTQLVGRRSKYTVTASDSYGRTWYWYSHLWVMPRRVDMADQSIAR